MKSAAGPARCKPSQRRKRQSHLIPVNEFKHLLRNRMTRNLNAILSPIALTTVLSVPASAQQDFTFTTLDGQSLSLAAQRGKVVVLLFSGTQDPQCRDAMQSLASLAERYQGKPVSIYWVSVNSPAEASNEQLRQACGPV